jgi:iron complex transport system substrate-binding protein
MFQDQWYVPQGESWAALFLKDAQADYLWQTQRYWKCILPEVILEKAQQAEFWIAPVIFFFKTNERQQSTLPEFESFKNKKVYSYALNKGARGILYFEWSPTVGLGFKGFHKDISSRISTKPHTVFQKLE